MNTENFFNGMFGKVQPGLVRLDMNGTDNDHYKMYCEKTKSFYHSLKVCGFSYKRRD